MKIDGIDRYDDKVTVVKEVVATLPEWFGSGTTIAHIEAASGSFEGVPFFAAYDGHQAVGYISLKVHNDDAAEVAMMAVLPTQHGKGLGRQLVERAEDFCRETGRRFLTVKTIDESPGNDSYEGTRAFYRKLHFTQVETMPDFWGEGLPCAYSIKTID